MTDDEMEIASFSSDWAIISSRRRRPGLVLCVQRQGAVNDTIGVAGIRLWLREEANGIPTPKEVFCGNGN